MQMRDFVVRFAGEGGQGVVTSAEGLAQSSTRVGYHALTFATFPSQILGGPTWTQARISVDPILAPWRRRQRTRSVQQGRLRWPHQ